MARFSGKEQAVTDEYGAPPMEEMYKAWYEHAFFMHWYRRTSRVPCLDNCYFCKHDSSDRSSTS